MDNPPPKKQQHQHTKKLIIRWVIQEICRNTIESAALQVQKMPWNSLPSVHGATAINSDLTFFQQHIALMATQGKIHFYFAVPAVFSNAFIKSAYVFHV